ncbi:prolyl oligopeptidase family serine peptidase [Nocardioides rubriscoriae]|uniref:prolyl oligopeptidase family serine peptidase n=1 Tax=Nocardioides rubriscoriae TaxID=642762 RepID=UPI0011E04DDC|nr:prolyl oligopeptidase family serine peptidase [Nocardioides rubriscoriae]
MTRVTRALPTALAVALATLLSVPAGALAADRPAPVAAAGRPTDLPAGVPAAATRAEPRLPVPHGWPFAQRLSRTSGTGRLHDGASYWTDFVYDDHGAAVPGGFAVPGLAKLAPTQGSYGYPAGASRGNGADVFVAATGLDESASYWRVDFNTLVDPDVPLAVWTFDTDARASTGTSQWPAATGVTSPGIDTALVVSSRGAWLHDLRTGRVTDVAARGGRLTVDRAARSFVVRVPRTLLPVSGRWTVRLATGLASADGRSMAPALVAGLPQVAGARPYNVAFRTVRQEKPVVVTSRTTAQVAAVQALAAGDPVLGQLGVDGLARFVTGNFWSEDAQADALADGDVSAFARGVDWGALGARRSTREPLVRGSSNRWYVSLLSLGQGVVANAVTSGAGDGEPNVLGRIQPYAVYVPSTYRPDRPAPLTWILHSLDVNHNQYAAYDPRLLQQLCERRGSVCASTLGHGPDGWYFDEAEVDYWSVWRQAAEAYTLDPARTVITGYSMGGWATYHLGLAHPDLYAAAVTLAGPPRCGISLDGDTLTNPAFGGPCTSDGSTAALLGNARHLPYRIGQGTVDQLVPFTSVEAQVGRLDDLGLRHRFVRYPGEDHLAWATQDRFDTVVYGLGRPHVVRRPRDVDYTWRPALTRPGLGIGVTTAYWTSGLAARRSTPGSLARVRATSTALPGRAHRVVRTGPTPVASPLPALREELTWAPGAALPIGRVLRLDLANVARIGVDMARAGLRCGTVRVRTDGPVVLRLEQLPDGTRTYRLSGDRTLHLPC